MATRFYVNPISLPGITPAFGASWDQTSAMVRRNMNTVAPKNLDAAVTFSDAETNVTNLWDVGLLQLISPPLAAQTITGTVAGQFLAAESDLLANDFSEVLVRVCSNDGTTFTGTLLAQTVGALEFVLTTATNAQFPAVANGTLSSVTANNGDRIVVEIGYQAQNVSVTSFTGSIVVNQGDLTTDLPVDTVATAANNSWIEFSQNLIFQPAYSAANRRKDFSDILATVTGSANAVTTLRLPGVLGCKHAIDYLHIQRSNNSNAAITGNATLTISTINLPGNPSWGVGNALGVGAQSTDINMRFARKQLLSSLPGTDTYISMPAAGASVSWTANCVYKLVSAL